MSNFEITKISEGSETDAWKVYIKTSNLYMGKIVYNKKQKKYGFTPSLGVFAFWDAESLSAIVNFLNEQNRN